MKTNLTVAFFFGPRRNVPYKTEKCFFLKQQVESLLKFNHNLDQITFVINGEVPEEYYSIVEPLTIRFNLKTLVRENIGIAYGAYSFSVDRFIDDFDFFIFSEDDWIFCVDDFDKYLLDKFNKNSSISMVCAVSSENDPSSHEMYGAHASVSIFASSRKKIKEIVSKYGNMPYSRNGYIEGQVYQTSKFFELGDVVDITDDFFVKFSDARGSQQWGDIKNKELCKQLDFIDNGNVVG